MAIDNWSILVGNEITNTTKIKDADNKLQGSMDDLVQWVNSTGGYSSSGLLQEVNGALSTYDGLFATFLSDSQDDVDTLIADTTANIQAIVDDEVVVEW